MGVEAGCKKAQSEHVVKTVESEANCDELEPAAPKIEGATALDVVGGCSQLQVVRVEKTEEIAVFGYDERGSDAGRLDQGLETLAYQCADLID